MLRTSRTSSAPNGRDHNASLAAASNAWPTSPLPPAARAFSRAWNSQVLAQRCQYRTYASRLRTRSPSRPSGRRSASTRKHRRRELERRPDVAGAHEQHVDVAGVVELPPAVLAHGHHGDARRGGQPPRAREHVIGHAGQAGAHLLQAIDAEQVPRRDAEHLQPLPAHQIVGRVGGARLPAVQIAQHLERPRIGLAQRGERPAGAEHRHHCPQQRGVGAETLDERRVVVEQACDRSTDSGGGGRHRSMASAIWPGEHGPSLVRWFHGAAPGGVLPARRCRRRPRR